MTTARQKPDPQSALVAYPFAQSGTATGGAAFAMGQRGESAMRICSLVIAVLLTASSARAHHSNAAFDGDKVLVLKGTVTEWKWSNPHVWILLSVTGDKGGKEDWAIEGRTPGQLVRAGWSRSSLKPGDVITVDFSPAKDGTRTGLLTRVRLADGTVLGQAPPSQ